MQETFGKKTVAAYADLVPLVSWATPHNTIGNSIHVDLDHFTSQRGVILWQFQNLSKQVLRR